MSFWRKSLAGAATMVGHSAATRALGVLSNGLLARLLLPAEFGSLQAVTNTANTLTQVLKLSVDTGLQVRLSESAPAQAGAPGRDDFVGTALVLALGLGLVALIAGFGFAAPLARMFGDAALQPLLGYAGVVSATQLVAQLSAVLLALGYFHAYGRINSLVALLYLIALGTVYASGVRGLTTIMAVFLGSQVLAGVFTVASAVRAWRQHGIRARFRAFVPTFVELAKIGIPLYLSAAAPATVWLALNAKLAEHSGIAALADVRIMLSVSQLVGLVPTAIAPALLTQLTAARGSSAYVPLEHFLRYTRLIVLGSTVTALGVSLVVPILVPTIFGHAYDSACQVAACCLLTTTTLTVKQSVLTGLISERRSFFALLDTFLATGTFALSGPYLIEHYGTIGFVLADFSGHLLSVLALSGALSARLESAALAREGLSTLGGLLFGLAALAVLAVLVHGALHWLVGGALLLCALLIGYGLLFTEAERSFMRREITRLWTRFRAVP